MFAWYRCGVLVNYGANMLWELNFSPGTLVLSLCCQWLLTHVYATRKGNIPFSKIKISKLTGFVKHIISLEVIWSYVKLLLHHCHCHSFWHNSLWILKSKDNISSGITHSWVHVRWVSWQTRMVDIFHLMCLIFTDGLQLLPPVTTIRSNMWLTSVMTYLTDQQRKDYVSTEMRCHDQKRILVDTILVHLMPYQCSYLESLSLKENG